MKRRRKLVAKSVSVVRSSDILRPRRKDHFAPCSITVRIESVKKQTINGQRKYKSTKDHSGINEDSDEFSCDCAEFFDSSPCNEKSSSSIISKICSPVSDGSSNKRENSFSVQSSLSDTLDTAIGPDGYRFRCEICTDGGDLICCDGSDCPRV